MVLIPRVPVGLNEAGDGLEGLSDLRTALRTLTYCGPVVLVPSSGLRSLAPAACSALLAPLLSDFDCSVGPVAASNEALVGELLNRGARTVLLSGEVAEIAEVELPEERLVACIPDLLQLSADDVELLGRSVGSVCVTVGGRSVKHTMDVARTCWEELQQRFPRGFSIVVESMLSHDEEERNNMVGALHHLCGHDGFLHVETSKVRYPVQLPLEDEEDEEDGRVGGGTAEASAAAPGRLQTAAAASGAGATSSSSNSNNAGSSGSDYNDGATLFDLGRAFVSCLKTDRPDGLFTTVVVDELGVALGLVYSSSSSVAASIAVGRGVYWSRSRNSLWRKGDSSGAYQELVSIAFDCDADALRFKVRQMGRPPAFCHLETRTCWGAEGGLGHLFRTLEERRQEAPEGSYTKRLFDDRTLLKNKLLEEAQEVIEAVEEGDAKHVAEEVADLTYFMLTACVAGGATLEQVARCLDMRALKVKRRLGDAKQHRIDAAAAVLNASKPPSPPSAPHAHHSLPHATSSGGAAALTI